MGLFKVRSILPQALVFDRCPIADVNGDGTLDIVTADELFDEVSVLLRQ